MIEGMSMASQSLAMPPGVTNAGLRPDPVASSEIALTNPALWKTPEETLDDGENPRPSLRLFSQSCITLPQPAV
ncbi:hypothetical protein MtrunA17_Chr1g0180101 [Medicago truncatula]|uniref:Uncharacterized protein n=1 Tax=Medicago truncatula TaxID=3880 RepID=A0A396JTN6_MEDTR|nr:hypothetical protein MtrunA17_Chr1g0180101 [Medicago truncatula]